MVWKEKIAASLDYETRDFKDQKEGNRERERMREKQRIDWAEAEERRKWEASEPLFSLLQFKEQLNGRSLQRLQAIRGIYEAPRGDRSVVSKGAVGEMQHLCRTFMLHSLRESNSPRRQLSDEVVAHVQDFKFLCFTQPVRQGLHMVPAGGEWVNVVIDYGLFFFLLYSDIHDWAELDINSICYKNI